MTMPLHNCFAILCQELVSLGETEAQSEAWHILRHVTKSNRTQLLLRWREPITKSENASIRKILKQRQTGMPLAYILGEWSFFGSPIVVHKGVLIPRPETERLVSVAKKILTEDMYVFELGVGTGAIPMALTMDHPIHYDGWDVSARAIRNARKNLTLSNTVQLHHQNFFSKQAIWRKKVSQASSSLLISNPPYIPPEDMPGLQSEVKNHEPRRALVGGHAGLSFYKRLCQQYLTDPSGQRHMVMEVGIHQKAPIDAILQKYPGYTWTWHADFEGIPRVVAVIPHT